MKEQKDVLKRKKRKKVVWGIIISFFFIVLGIGIFNRLKPLPKGLSYESEIYYTDDVAFLSDLTYENLTGDMTNEQEIFHEVFQMIKEAKETIVIDMFLFNSYVSQNRDFPNLSGKLTETLITQKERYPNLQVIFITDPINTGYHSYEDQHIQLLKENGVDVILTNLSQLRDSNKMYSSVWRLFFQAFGQKGKGWLPNPFAKDAPSFTLRSYLELFNVKANHRKVVLTENAALIASANPHNESGFASNIAFKVSGDIIHEIAETEQAVIDYSEGKTKINQLKQQPFQDGNIALQYLTEGKILKHLLAEIEQTKEDDEIWLGMFYIANRGVIDALHEAADRGVEINLILDPNTVAFGNRKTGLPNVPIAAELNKKEGLSIRWYNAKEDQYHTKLLYIKKEQDSVLIGGSANHTTRNLDDLNLENNIKIMAPNDTEVVKAVDDYFHRLWHNEDGVFTLDYESNEDMRTPWLTFIYWIQKLTGWTTY